MGPGRSDRHGYTVTAPVAAPAAVVWQVLADVEAMPTWTASMDAVRRLDGGPFGLGSRARVRQPGLPPATWVVDEWRPPEVFAWTSRAPGVRTTGRHEVRARGERRSEVTLSVRQDGVLAGLMWRWTGATARRYVDLEIAGLAAAAAGRAEQPDP
ncbi:SRPBCC family protein [Isoptericola sp. NPDC057653]|uniref:SRPBCC family protein n=1 Tax=Isoptericola sp. NPDC057653 TaxID=3346195 RepID=UPI0036A1E1D0